MAISKFSSFIQKKGWAIPNKNKSLFHKLLEITLNWKITRQVKKFETYINGSNLVDIGTGLGTTANYLLGKGYRVTHIDVENKSIYKDIQPMIYDGYNLPFMDDSFDSALLIHVLHHCNDPEKTLTEAIRVAKRVIIMEDTYKNDFEKNFVSLNDMISNFEFYEHPYKKTEEWLKLFHKYNCDCIHINDWLIKFIGIPVTRWGLYVIEKTNK